MSRVFIKCYPLEYALIILKKSTILSQNNENLTLVCQVCVRKLVPLRLPLEVIYLKKKFVYKCCKIEN